MGAAPASTSFDPLAAWPRARYAALLVAALVAVGVAVFWKYLDGSRYFLFTDMGSDTVLIMWPRWHHFAELVRGEGLPGWSHQVGFGQNVWSLVFTDPFTLVYYAVGPERIPQTIVWVELAKLVIAGLLFHGLLRSVGFTRVASLAGSLAFAYSGFAVLGACWYVFSTEVVYLAAWLLALERVHARRATWSFTLVAALVGACQPFDLYVFALFSVLYLIVRELLRGPVGRERWGHVAGTLARCALWGALGLALVAFQFLPQVATMLESAALREQRIAGALEGGVFHLLEAEGWKDYAIRSFGTRIYRAIHEAGRGWDYPGWKNPLEAPAPYVGLLPLLAAPLWLAAASRRKRAIGVGVASAVLVVVAFPWFRRLFWAFADDFFRVVALLLALPLLFAGLAGLERALERHAARRGVPLGRVVAVGLALAVALLLLWWPWYEDYLFLSRPDPRPWLSAALAAYGVLLCVPGLPRWRAALMLTVLAVELAGSGRAVVNRREVIDARRMGYSRGYFDGTGEAVARLRELDPGFWRLWKGYLSGFSRHLPFNESQVQGFFGYRSYHSFNEPDYVRLLVALELADAERWSAARWVQGPGPDADVLALTAGRYGVCRLDDTTELEAAGWSELLRTERVAVFENPRGATFGRVHARAVREREARTWPVELRAARMLELAVVGDEVDAATLPVALLEEYAARERGDERGAFTLERWSSNEFVGSVSAEAGLLVVALPFDPGWSAFVDGERVRTLRAQFGLTGVVLGEARGPARQVELRFEPPLRRAGGWLALGAWLVFGASLAYGRRRSA